jgi:hypothetical protein
MLTLPREPDEMQLVFDISSAAFATRHCSEFAGIGTQLGFHTVAKPPHRRRSPRLHVDTLINAALPRLANMTRR